MPSESEGAPDPERQALPTPSAPSAPAGPSAPSAPPAPAAPAAPCAPRILTASAIRITRPVAPTYFPVAGFVPLPPVQSTTCNTLREPSTTTAKTGVHPFVPFDPGLPCSP